AEMPKTERTLLGFKRDFDINSQLYNYLLQKSAEAAISLASNDPDVQVLDKASIENVEKVGFKPYVNVLIGLIFAFLITFIAIILSEFTNTRLKNAEYVMGSLNLSIAGFIPHNASNMGIPVLKRPYSAITESFRDLRTTLQFLLQDSNKNI